MVDFRIELGEEASNFASVGPEDPLNELDRFTMGINLFCFRNNRRVYLLIGEDVVVVRLYPDICIALTDMVMYIGNRDSNRRSIICFPEMSVRIILQEEDDSHALRCIVQRFGRVHEESSNLVEKDSVAVQIRRFVYHLIWSALDSNLVTKIDVSLALGGDWINWRS